MEFDKVNLKFMLTTGILSLLGAGAPPMAKVMRKEARHTQRRDRASGVPLEILVAFFVAQMVKNLPTMHKFWF